LLLSPNEVEKRGELPEEKEGNLLIRETMKKEELIKELHVLNHLLDELVERTHEKINNSQKIRKLSQLPNTLHNKVRIRNYIKNGTEQN